MRKREGKGGIRVSEGEIKWKRRGEEEEKKLLTSARQSGSPLQDSQASHLIHPGEALEHPCSPVTPTKPE